MTTVTRTGRPPSLLLNLWRSTVGKKAVMAVSGLLMLLYLVFHMLGNLQIFFGPQEINYYAHWLRTLGMPFLRYEWLLWIFRAGLTVCVVAHGVSAYQLSRRDIAARPTKYAHQRQRATYATRTMRWGGVILGLFIIWHILDLTTGTVNPVGEHEHPYQNIVASFDRWYSCIFYILAMLALGLHIRHGFWSAAQTLGANNARLNFILKLAANGLALLLSVGFVSVPLAVMFGVVK
ncbi:succinate dehydrogenase cytochrome b subunit [Kitasatospora sp. NPDC094028]